MCPHVQTHLQARELGNLPHTYRQTDKGFALLVQDWLCFADPKAKYSHQYWPQLDTNIPPLSNIHTHRHADLSPRLVTEPMQRKTLAFCQGFRQDCTSSSHSQHAAEHNNWTKARKRGKTGGQGWKGKCQWITGDRKYKKHRHWKNKLHLHQNKN